MMGNFPTETIPNDARLLRRIPNWHYRNNGIEPAAYSLKGGMSCDWTKYSTPQQSIDRAKEQARKKGNTVEFAGVVCFICGRLRSGGFDVQHRPREYQAHCEVYGEDNPENRIMISRASEGWSLKLVP